MDRYICNECGNTFCEPHQHIERHGFTSGPYEVFNVCPYCGDTDYEEAFECDSCGQMVPVSQKNIVKCNDDGVRWICDKCYEEE